MRTHIHFLNDKDLTKSLTAQQEGKPGDDGYISERVMGNNA